METTKDCIENSTVNEHLALKKFYLLLGVDCVMALIAILCHAVLTVTHVKIERYFARSKIGQKKVDVEVKIKQKQLSSLVKATYEKN